MHITRRQFVLSTLSIAGGALILSGCEDDSSGNPPADGGTPTEVLTTIGANHGHVLVVSVADVQAAVEKTYDISGSAGHAHSVTVSAANFGALSDQGTLALQSTIGSGHNHSIMIVF
jgi:hypothetical protein